MTKSLTINKVTLPPAALKAMSPEMRYALLMLGLMLNEANWLRKLLLPATVSIADDPEGQASFGLTTLLATTLAGKIHEGWNLVETEKLGLILTAAALPAELEQIRASISSKLKSDTFLRIRNNIAFHYPKRVFDFKKLDPHLDEDATVIYAAEQGHGNVFSHLSSLAVMEPLVAIDGHMDYMAALTNVWNEVMEVAGLYCEYTSNAMAAIIQSSVPDVHCERFSLADTPEGADQRTKFFSRGPETLDELQQQAGGNGDHSN
jgi:hypothetical protein